MEMMTVEIEGRCPKCGSDHIETTDQGIEDTNYYYESKCFDCGQHFTEWYNMIYDETIWENDDNGDV